MKGITAQKWSMSHDTILVPDNNIGDMRTFDKNIAPLCLSKNNMSLPSFSMIYKFDSLPLMAFTAEKAL